MILLGVGVATILWANLANKYVWVVLAVTLAYGAIGFIDDFLKVTKRSTGGFSGKDQAVAGTDHRGRRGLLDHDHRRGGLFESLAVPFFKDVLIDLGPLFIVLGVIVIAGAGNAVNLTDGLDGLAIVPVMIAAGAFGMISYLVGNAIFADYLQIHFVPGTGELAVVCGALVGAGLGFLWFNAPPALIFMGDTGSLALGGRSGRSRWRPSTRSCWRSSAGCSCWRRCR